MPNTNQFLIRAKDIALIISVVTLIGMIMGPMKKIVELEDVPAKMDRIEAIVNGHTSDIAVTRAQFEQIEKQLDQINWTLRRIAK